jgi:hypothetical protein
MRAEFFVIPYFVIPCKHLKLAARTAPGEGRLIEKRRR